LQYKQGEQISPTKMENSDLYREFVKIKRKIVITTHQNPDADGLGSSLAFARYLAKLGHQVQVISPTPYPDFLEWMPKKDEVCVFREGNENACLKYIEEADIIFCIDFSSYNRLANLEPYVRKSKAKIGMIDHHLSPNIKPDFALWKPEAAASAELIYEWIEYMQDLELLDQDIAGFIYAGLVTDTQSFRLGTTTPHSFRVAANLLEKGLDIAKINRMIYDNKEIEKLKFLGFVLQNKII
jgi:phosphoesterase RecJ-like protein